MIDWGARVSDENAKRCSISSSAVTVPGVNSSAPRLSVSRLHGHEAVCRLNARTMCTYQPGVNLGGHKLPTAFPSRRVWLTVTVPNESVRILFSSGQVEAKAPSTKAQPQPERGNFRRQRNGHPQCLSQGRHPLHARRLVADRDVAYLPGAVTLDKSTRLRAVAIVPGAPTRGGSGDHPDSHVRVGDAGFLWD